jgi:type IV pilus assembly protein PilB
MLRQAPNVILVGEIRDGETAKTAVEAALTGHLVFSTLHTNDAPSSITRLVDMGVPPFLIASSVQAVLAQRLVRRICNDCKHEIAPETALLKSAGVPDDLIAANKYYAGSGCDTCRNSGFKGRQGIYEIMIMTARLREMAFQRETTDHIRRQAVADGMHTLLDDGIRKVFDGITTMGEVLSVAKRMD